MLLSSLELLRCPHCGGRLTYRTDLFHDQDGDCLIAGILACYCAQFPVVSGIAVMTIEGVAETAREEVEAGDTAGAVRTMFAGGDDAVAERYDEIVRPAPTYAGVVTALGDDFVEGRYFLYRFSDPTFLAADGVLRALAPRLLGEGRAVDICGGAGHLTRTLAQFTTTPVLMDWSFPKLWLARRFIAPSADLVCADAQTALPFRTGAFTFAVCSDAFHYIWSKAVLAHEMVRLVGDRGVVAITHAHNALQSNESEGMPLHPAGYRDLFEAFGGRVFSERRLLDGILSGHVDLQSVPPEDELNDAPAVTIVATRRDDVFRTHGVLSETQVRGNLRINPLYAVDVTREGATLRLAFPSEEYEREFGHSRDYLPEQVTLDRDTVTAIESGAASPRIAELRALHVLLDLPRGFID